MHYLDFINLSTFRATLPPEEDLQTYKRSLIRFHNINAPGSRINFGQIATLIPQRFSLEEYWVNNNTTSIYTSIHTFIYL